MSRVGARRECEGVVPRTTGVPRLAKPARHARYAQEVDPFRPAFPPALRRAAERIEYETADGFVGAGRQVPAEALVQFSHRSARAHDEHPRRDAPVQLTPHIIFILDLADNLLDEILDGDEPDESAVLV